VEGPVVDDVDIVVEAVFFLLRLRITLPTVGLWIVRVNPKIPAQMAGERKGYMIGKTWEECHGT